MSICSKLIEPVKTKTVPAVKPKPYVGDGEALTIYVVRKADREAWRKMTGTETAPMGTGKGNSGAICMRESLVPHAYRSLDGPEKYDHRHYYERLHKVPGSETFRCDDEFYPVDKPDGHLETVAWCEACIECHCHEGGHTVLDLRHDADGYPIMDGHTAKGPERVILGRRGDKTERDRMFNEIFDRKPAVIIRQWTVDNHPFRSGR